MFFQLCPRNPIKQNTQIQKNYTKLSMGEILLRIGVHMRPQPCPAHLYNDDDSKPILETGRKGLK